jgi:hypothetical protein
MKSFRSFFGFALLLAGLSVSASAQDLPVYELRIRPDYVANDQEAVFQVESSFGSVDTFHIDFVNRRWTKYDEFGSTTGRWDPADDVYLNPSNPQGLFCLAGPWAFAGCAVGVIVAVPVGVATCNAMANAAVRRAQQACASGGRHLEIRNSGTCGQRMETYCRAPLGKFQEP